MSSAATQHLAGRANPPRYDAFVSAVSSECGRARDAAAVELRKLGKTVAVQSDLRHGPAGVTLLQTLHDTIRDCAEVHCIVGVRSGACPPRDEAAALREFPLPPGMTEASYTQWEFLFARHYLPDRTWLYLAAESYQPDEPAPTGPDRPALQQQFRDWLRARNFDHARFANVDGLRAEVLARIAAGAEERASAAAHPAHTAHEPLRRGITANAVGSFIAGALLALLSGGLAQWAGGHELLALLLVPALLLGAACAGAFFMLYRRYEAILARHDTDACAAYDGLRSSLAEGGGAARVYARWLRLALDAVDRFFGDSGMADRTLFPRAFGLRTPAPLWTAASFDRCLLLALVYPVGTVLLFWVISGHVGPAEHALLLPKGLPAWRRDGSLVVIAIVSYCWWRGARGEGWRVLAWFAVAVAVTGAVAAAVAVAGAGAVAAAVAGAGVGAFAGAGAFAFAGAFAGAFAFYLAVDYLNGRATRDRWQGPFQTGLITVLALVCFAAADLGSLSEKWPIVGGLLLFLGLLTLINAPFDWAALGLTRALLRRGLELGAWFPYVLAAADAVLAAAVIALLTIVSVLGVQAFDDLAEHAGGAAARILPLDALFNGIAANPGAPEYWWAYAMLFSTMIPSLLNLMIGGASLLRGVPWITRALLHGMPQHRAPASFNRSIIALVLTGQVFLGGLLGIAAQALFFYAVIGLALPVLGLDLLGLARAVAAPDLPGALIHWVLGPPLH